MYADFRSALGFESCRVGGAEGVLRQGSAHSIEVLYARVRIQYIHERGHAMILGLWR